MLCSQPLQFYHPRIRGGAPYPTELPNTHTHTYMLDMLRKPLLHFCAPGTYVTVKTRLAHV